MNKNPSLQKGDPGMWPASSEYSRESIELSHHETNITEGSEFLDDAIRIKDQPFEEPPEEDQQTEFQTKKIKFYEFY